MSNTKSLSARLKTMPDEALVADFAAQVTMDYDAEALDDTPATAAMRAEILRRMEAGPTAGRGIAGPGSEVEVIVGSMDGEFDRAHRVAQIERRSSTPCGQRWVAEVESCPRCGLKADAHDNEVSGTP